MPMYLYPTVSYGHDDNYRSVAIYKNKTVFISINWIEITAIRIS